MDKGAERAIDSFAEDLRKSFNRSDFSREKLLARDTNLHLETKYFLDRLASIASEITDSSWSFSFGDVGYDGGGESTSIVVFPMKNSFASFPFRIIYRPQKLTVVGAINGERSRTGDGKWELISQAFQAIVVQS